MAYTNVISRTDAAALIPEQVSDVILKNVASEGSAALRLMRNVPMSTNQTRMPVLSALPVAYFVNGDTGLKQTTEANWANKFLNAEEIACICPIPEAVLDDTAFDVWGAIRPLIEEAIARTLDAAIFFGSNKPSSWPTALVTGAVAASNTVTRGTASAANGGIAEDFNQLFGKVEGDGFDVNGVVSRTSMKPRFRSARDTTGQLLADLGAGEVLGEPLVFAMKGLWPAIATGAADAIAGDWSEGIIATRQDITYKILDQAALFDDAGQLIFNLPQQDMVAMRVVARYAWQVSNSLNREGANDATQYPWAVMLEP